MNKAVPSIVAAGAVRQEAAAEPLGGRTSRATMHRGDEGNPEGAGSGPRTFADATVMSVLLLRAAIGLTPPDAGTPGR